jgi:quinone-modifying oxidoreductase subunit QmoC
VEEGEWVKMCMQCGVCAGSCPLGNAWEHPPQEIFMMIRAGKREEVLSSESMWMCTSCYNCIVRCPRELPITHIMHGLAHYAKRLGLAPQNQPTAKFSQLFWNNLTWSNQNQYARIPWAGMDRHPWRPDPSNPCRDDGSSILRHFVQDFRRKRLMKKGRVNELKLGIALYFMNGFGEGIKVALKQKDLGLAMLKAKRMNPMEALGGHGVKDLAGFQKIIRKAQQLEDARIKQHGA